MGSDCYKVEILHYLNPHLIWVEVTEPTLKREDYTFEQIGIYGVLPLEMTIDVVEDTVGSNRSQTWMPAAAGLMKKALSGATEVYFCPTHIDRRSSIFDDNIHKFGELIITRATGKQKKLSKWLVKDGFAMYDECLFHQELSLGNLKTKLNNAKVRETITQLEKYYTNKEGQKRQGEKSLQKQTTISHTAQQLESILTVENLEARNRFLSQKYKNVDDVLLNKLKDLEMCKDINEVSLGRGIHKRADSEVNSSAVTRKLKLIKESPKKKPMVNQDPTAAIEYMKRILLKCAVNKKGNSATSEEDLRPVVETIKHKNNTVQEEKHISSTTENFDNCERDIQYPKHVFKNDAIEKEVNISNSNTKQFEYKEHDVERDMPWKPQEKKTDGFKEIDRTEIKQRHDTIPSEFNNESMDDYTPQRSCRKKATKSHRDRNTIPKYDILKEKRVAYGPPDLDKSKLCQKIVPLKQTEESLTVPEVVEDKIPIKDNFFGDVDSDVEIEIPRKETLSVQAICKAPEELHLQNEAKEVDRKIRRSDIQSKETYISKKSIESQKASPSSLLLKRKLRVYTESKLKNNDSSFSSLSDTSNKDTSTSNEDLNQRKAVKKQTELDSDADESMSEVLEKLNLEYPPAVTSPQPEVSATNHILAKNHVNPFKNLDPNISGFVEKLVTPVMMVHSKHDKRIQPSYDWRDIHFSSHIHIILKNMKIEKPMMLQTVSWLTILRGYSIFMISPKGSGKTMGYLPAVCRLISDSSNETKGVGPICIIICATANSVTEVERLSKNFLGSKHKVLACYVGMSELDLTTSLLNGCDLLISTPSILVRLLKSTDLCLDLRKLLTFILDDCERASEVYGHEIQFFLLKIKEMLKRRVQKEMKVQYILASRVWCDFMEPLAKRAPDTVISIGAFQECVLYAKANTTACFVSKANKIRHVLEFLKEIDNSKKTVIVCREDREVEILEQALKKSGYVSVFACNNTMTVQDLFKLSLSWVDYQEPVSGPILVCCDGNLTQMNVTDAHYLFHYSLPHLFSMFCKRFAVLNENYASIFKTTNESVKIKILLENNNVEQLPKILNFIKRCTNEVPKILDEASERVLAEKDALKAKNLVPFCDNLLALGKCPDFWNCQERHTVFKECEEPKDWVPKSGVFTFRILYYHSAVFYSARLLSTDVNGQTTNYPQTHNMLTMKISKYFGNESNKRLHGVPAVGDICAVSLKQHFFVRCQVVKILSYYQKGNPNHVLIRLIDEERLERSRDIYLYHLPEEMKKPETYVVHVRLANIQPKDKDITFSELAKNQLKEITEKNGDLCLRGEIALTIGNCLLVSNIESFVTLESMNNIVFRHNFRHELEAHATSNPEHISELRKLCQDGGITVKQDIEVEIERKTIKELPEGQWAHLEKGDLSPVYHASVEDPGTFFVRLVHFQDCLNILIKDIQKYVADTPESVTDIRKGDIVLAQLPDDKMYERARVDNIIDANKVKCFFVDQGDWREVSTKNLAPITEKLINQLPFQAIECRMIGVQPYGEEWAEFGINWFNNFLEDDTGKLKQLYVKYFTKEDAQYTRGHKYGVALIDTNTNKDVLINTLMIEVNLAREIEEEIPYLNDLDFTNKAQSCDSQYSDNEEEWEKIQRDTVPKEITRRDSPNSPIVPLENIFMKKPIRSVPLVDSDFESDDMDINMIEDFMGLFKPMDQNLKSNLPAIESVSCQKQNSVTQSDSDISVQSLSSKDIQVVPSSNKIIVLDSDDLTSPDSSQLSEEAAEKITLLTELDQSRKPKLCWRQNATNVFIKIMLIGIEDYDLRIGEKQLNFNGIANETNYAFEFELYGVVDSKSSTHSNKGLYILVNLKKVLKNNWLTLAKDYSKKWIVYDVDHIEDCSDDENFYYDTSVEAIRHMQKSDTESDDDFADDLDYDYRRH